MFFSVSILLVTVRMEGEKLQKEDLAVKPHLDQRCPFKISSDQDRFEPLSAWQGVTHVCVKYIRCIYVYIYI